MVPKDYIENRPFYDRFTSLRFTTKLNRQYSCIHIFSYLFVIHSLAKKRNSRKDGSWQDESEFPNQ